MNKYGDGHHLRILVLGDVTRMVLPVLRSLGRRGIECHVAWCGRDEAALRSRYLHECHLIPWHEPGTRDWIVALNRLIERERFDLVLPVTDATVYALQTHRGELTSASPIYLLDDDAFRVVFDKLETCRLAESLDVMVPPTFVLEPGQSVDTLVQDLCFPVVVKPRCSVRNIGQSHFVRFAHSPAELQFIVDQLYADGAEVLLQQHFTGTGVGVEILAHRGRILTAFQHKRLHETNGAGSTYRESVPVDPELYRACSRLVEALNYTGVAMFEFRQNASTGASALLEINGRFWGSLPLAVAAGADFPYFLAQMLLHDRRTFPSEFRTGCRARALSNDFFWAMRWLRERSDPGAARSDGGNGWSINRIPRMEFLADALRCLLWRDYVDSFAWDDPAPGIYEVRQLICYAVERAFARFPFPFRDTRSDRQAQTGPPEEDLLADRVPADECGPSEYSAPESPEECTVRR